MWQMSRLIDMKDINSLLPISLMPKNLNFGFISLIIREDFFLDLVL